MFPHNPPRSVQPRIVARHATVLGRAAANVLATWRHRRCSGRLGWWWWWRGKPWHAQTGMVGPANRRRRRAREGPLAKCRPAAARKSVVVRPMFMWHRMTDPSNPPSHERAKPQNGNGSGEEGVRARAWCGCVGVGVRRGWEVVCVGVGAEVCGVGVGCMGVWGGGGVQVRAVGVRCGVKVVYKSARGSSSGARARGICSNRVVWRSAGTNWLSTLVQHRTVTPVGNRMPSVVHDI